MFNLGIIFALVALICWGFGDFLIQRSARKFGNWESLFIISLIGSVILFPFILKDTSFLVELSIKDFGVLLLVALSFFLSAFINMEALKRGKLAVIESIGAVEILVAGLLSYLIWGEKLSFTNWFFVLLLISGILLVALKPQHFRKETWIEKGAALALTGAIIMGLTDFMISFGAKVANPIITVWFFNIVMVSISSVYLQVSGKFGHFLKDLRLHKDLMSGVGLLDNIAWLSFAISTTFIPLVVSLALSESYIILATSLGIFANKERLRYHQFVGIIIAIISVIILSALFS